MVEPEQSILGSKLQELGHLNGEESTELMLKAEEKGVPFASYLVSSGRLDKTDVYEAYAQVFNVPYVDISNFDISDEALKIVSNEIAHRFKVIPLFRLRDTLNIAMVNPADMKAIDLISQKSQCTVDACLAAPDDIEEALTRYYGSKSVIDDLLQGLKQEKKRNAAHGKSKAGMNGAAGRPIVNRNMQAQTVIQLVDLILQQAYEEGASDVHIEPEKDMLRVRCRIDGVLQQSATPPKAMESEILSRIKILAEMDIAETRIPQDGRIKLDVKGKEIDLRVSSMPTVYGENIVIRILKDANATLNLSHLGFTDEMKWIFEELIRRPYGMILETGPTGSGKTTSLYAALQTINTVERNIITVEDPVEYKLPLIRQVPVNNKAGMGFATALRSILRQDPDVIMVGEIRDSETAEIAIQAALTGHLVLSTLHTNTASGVVTRLVDMDIEPFLVASSVIGVVSQRLVRKVCEKCKKPHEANSLELRILKWDKTEKLKSVKGAGCRHCNNTGYKGRVGVFEMLVVDDEIQKLILEHASAREIEKAARANGTKSLLEDAVQKIHSGLTTIDEIIKAIGVS